MKDNSVQDSRYKLYRSERVVRTGEAYIILAVAKIHEGAEFHIVESHLIFRRLGLVESWSYNLSKPSLPDTGLKLPPQEALNWILFPDAEREARAVVHEKTREWVSSPPEIEFEEIGDSDLSALMPLAVEEIGKSALESVHSDTDNPALRDALGKLVNVGDILERRNGSDG